jgi:hypothetical protein
MVLERGITLGLMLLLASIPYSSLIFVTSQSATGASPGSLIGGPGEAWTLTFYGSKPSSLATLQEEWNTYYARTDFLTYKNYFGWNLIRLSFCFVNICGLGPYSLDPTNTTQMSWFDWVVSAANSNGLMVIPAEFSFTGSGPTSAAEMSAFIADWGAFSRHENGSLGIALYQVANEITDNREVNSVYGSLNSFLGNVTNEIRNQEPGRLVAWITGPPYPDGTTGVEQDWHVSMYQYNSSGEFSGCVTAYDLGYWPSMLTKDYGAYGVPAINGEINSEEVAGEPLVNGQPMCNAQAVEWIVQMISYKIPYILWGYNAYRNNWDSILKGVISLSRNPIRLEPYPLGTTPTLALATFNSSPQPSWMA